MPPRRQQQPELLRCVQQGTLQRDRRCDGRGASQITTTQEKRTSVAARRHRDAVESAVLLRWVGKRDAILGNGDAA